MNILSTFFICQQFPLVKNDSFGKKQKRKLTLRSLEAKGGNCEVYFRYGSSQRHDRGSGRATGEGHRQAAGGPAGRDGARGSGPGQRSSPPRLAKSATSGHRTRVPLRVVRTELREGRNFSECPRLRAGEPPGRPGFATIPVFSGPRYSRTTSHPAGRPYVRAHRAPHLLLPDPPLPSRSPARPGPPPPLGSAFRSPSGTALRGRPGRCRTAAGTAPPRARSLPSAPAPRAAAGAAAAA